jgi:thermitase
MIQRSELLRVLGVLLMLLALLVPASYAQGTEPDRDAPGQVVAQPQPGVDIHSNDGTPPPKYTPEQPMETPEPTEPPEHEFYSFGQILPVIPPASDGTNIGAWQGTLGGGPRQFKEAALAELNAIYPTGENKVDYRLRKAIEYIEKSLEADLWETDLTLTKKGGKVFHRERWAVKTLGKILKEADVDQAIEHLITADEALASIAIYLAKAMASDTGCYDDEGHHDFECRKLLYKIAIAEVEMIKAEEDIGRGKYDRAINHYKKAWHHARVDRYEFYGLVQEMPEDGLFGTWVLVTSTGFEVTFVAAVDDAEFIEDDGALEPGAYVKVTYYVSDGVTYAAEIATKDYYVPRQVIARLKPEADISDVHSDYKALTLGRLLDRVYLLGLEAGTNEQDTVDNMQNDSRIVYAEPNLIGQVPEAGGYEMGAWAGYDPAPALAQYANEHLDLPLARELSTGSGVVVAVLDTGVQLDHPALASQLGAGYDFVDGDTVPADEGNGLDDDGDELVDETVGHGTHVAGIVLLVAPESQIMPLRVLNSDGVGSAFQAAEAIIYATDQGAQVLNLSLGTGVQSQVLQEAVDYARSAGVMIVAAAGNLNNTEPQYPAANEGVIAVAALDEQQLKTSFSNYGSWVDLAAPGESIYSALPADGYGWWSGTSMATPFVSGQIALLQSLAPWLTPAQIEGQMMAKALNLDELNPDYAEQLGAGEPDVAASLGCHWADVEPDATHDILNNTCDDDVDIADVQTVASQWNLPQPPGSVYDNDHDGDVDVVDVQRVANCWGWIRQH